MSLNKLFPRLKMVVPIFWGFLVSWLMVSSALADNFFRYDFTFFYNNGSGDRYSGYFFANGNLGYKLGSKKIITADENSQPGYYQIVAVMSIGTDGALDKKVFVNSYFNSENKEYYLPVNYNKPIGINYWGSECGYIIQKDVAEHRFGYYQNKFYEADISGPQSYNGFTFKFTYSSGDYYSGSVFAEPNKYVVGWTSFKKDENGDWGFYEITGRTTGVYNSAKNGQVWVAKYWDSESRKSFVPLKYNVEPAGSNYLGSERDYIKAEENQYYFGYGYYEADLTNKYYFTYTFGNGDYYNGYVYAPADYDNHAYQIDYSWDTIDENKQRGWYKITAIQYDFDHELNGKVFVTKYYDAESNSSPPIYEASSAKGNYYLGSESGYIIKPDINQYKFGDRYEADVTLKYFYTFTFGNGDYYKGYGYAGADYENNMYRVGYIKRTIDENKKQGIYKINAVQYGYTDAQKKWHYYDAKSQNGLVYITSYYDKESNMSLPVVNASKSKTNYYLGKEIGYIIKENVDQYKFGRGYNEADVTNRYYFRYNYADGDYYTGWVYAVSDPKYYTTNNPILWNVDEKGRFGSYTITGVDYNQSYLLNGQVFVNAYYYSHGLNYRPAIYTPFKWQKLTYAGSYYLGSESDYIINNNNSKYYFSNYYEVDPGL